MLIEHGVSVAISYFAGSFRVSLVMKEGPIVLLGICLGTFMISSPTLSYSHWWEFVYITCHHALYIGRFQIKVLTTLPFFFP